MVIVAALGVGATGVGAVGAKPSGQETPKQFVARFAEAIREGDTAFLFKRLNAAVVDRYGAPLCRGFVRNLEDPTAEVVVQEVGPPEPWDYTSEGETTTVPKTRTVTVLRTTRGEESTATIHLAPRGKKLTWFAMCRPHGTDAVAATLEPYTGTYAGTWRDTRFDVGGDMKVVVTTSADAGTLTLSLDFTGSLFGATAPVHEDLAPISLDIATFGTPVTGTSEVFGPYTVTYTALGSVTIEMPRCPAGSCTLTGTLTPGRFDGSVSVALRDGTTSQGTVTLRTDDA